MTRPCAAAFLAAAATLLTLTACGPGEEPATVADSIEARTRLVAQMSWDEQDLDTRAGLCESVALLGHEWAAEQIASGLSADSVGDIDPGVSATFVEEKCHEEGLWPAGYAVP